MECEEVLIKIEGEDGELTTVTSLHVADWEKSQGIVKVKLSRKLYFFMNVSFKHVQC